MGSWGGGGTASFKWPVAARIESLYGAILHCGPGLPGQTPGECSGQVLPAPGTPWYISGKPDAQNYRPKITPHGMFCRSRQPPNQGGPWEGGSPGQTAGNCFTFRSHFGSIK